MQIKQIIAWSIWLSIFSLLTASQSLTQNLEDKCFCNFDTDNYKAKCDCAILCAVAVKEGKDCNIVCDGSINSAINGADYFGERRKYLDDMSNIIQFATRNGFNSFQDSYFSERALPKLIRSAYVNANFIGIDKKGELDNLILTVFNKYDKKIVNSFSGKNKDGVKIDLSKKYNRKVEFKASFKSIELIDSDYHIKLFYLK